MSTRPTTEPDRVTSVEVNRTRLRLWEWGDPSAPPVLLLHGAYDHGRLFDGIAPRIAALGYHAVAVDFRGHGDSGGLDHGHTFDASVLDIGLLSARYDRPVGMVAHSMGASMAFQAAATWPERVAWIVSLDGLGPPHEAFDRPPLAQGATEQLEAAITTYSRDRRPFPDTAAMAAQRGAINGRLSDEWLAHLVDHGSVRIGEHVSWKWDPAFNTYLPTGFAIDWATEDLNAVECPILAFTGSADDMWTFPEDQQAERVALFQDIRHVPVADAGHYVHLEQPDLVMEHVQRFLAEVAS